MALDEPTFQRRFRRRAILVPDLPPGRPRDLAAAVIAARTDGGVHTATERSALFAALCTEYGGGPELAVTDAAGAPTPAGAAVRAYDDAALDTDGLFAQPLLQVHVTGFGVQELWEGGGRKTDPRPAPPGARLAVSRIDPDDGRATPPAPAIFATDRFALENTGNKTLMEAKSSWRARLQGDELLTLRRLHLKSMVNDASMVREHVAWDAFARAGVPCSRRTYARYTMDRAYRGLYSVTEDVHGPYLTAKFGRNDRGPLFKGNCGDADRGGFGCATLAHRGPAGADYRPLPLPAGVPADQADPTYELRTDHDPAAAYDGLARLVRAVHGDGIAGGDARFATDAYRERVEQVFHVRPFLRWAGVNVLLGSWDTYYGTGANYFLYNSGPAADPDAHADAPFFTFLPWDYDNVLGITYDATQRAYGHADWARADLRAWPRSRHGDGSPRLPLLVNLLRNPDLERYYLDHLVHLLDTTFAPAALAATARAGWERAARSAYLEADTPFSRPFTGRRWINHEVFLHAEENKELRVAFSGDDRRTLQGITEFARLRHESATAQLHGHVPTETHFPTEPEPVP